MAGSIDVHLEFKI